MKKQIAKTVSILSLLVVLSVGAASVSAFPVCSRPNCPAVKPRVQNVAPPAQDLNGQATVAIAKAENSFSLTFFLVRLAMSFLYLH